MTNLEKLIQVLGETFPGTKFVEKEILEDLASCGWLACYNHSGVCEKCPTEDFWHQRYVPNDLKDPEKPEKTHTGYMVMVEDDGKFVSYSGCIHPSYSNAMEELDNAEYHGWLAHIKSVEFVMKGGEWKNA